jgi:hypothetical protein
VLVVATVLVLATCTATPSTLAAPATTAAPVAAQQQPPPTAPPREDVRLVGRLLRPDGAPLAQHPIVVDAVSSGDLGSALFAFFGTFGLACIADAFVDPSSNVCIPEGGRVTRYSGRTDSAGRYSILLPSAHYVGQESNTDFYLRVAMPPRQGQRSGPAAEYELEVIDPVQEAPDMRLWDSNLRITPSGGRARVDWTPFDAGGRSRNTGGEIEPANLIDLDLSSPGTTFDLHLLEDTQLTVRQSAAIDVRNARTIYHQRFVAPAVAFKGTFVPLSRGKPCAPAPCGLTDGDLVTPAAPPTAPTIDLGAEVPVWLVVARGCSGCSVSVSRDGVAFRPLSTTDQYGRARAGIPRKVRFVRVDGAPTQLAEVSAWDTTPVRGTVVAGPPTLGDFDATSTSRMFPLALALAALGLTAAGAVLAWRRASRPR